MTICGEHHDVISRRCVACRRAVAHGTLPSHQSRESLAQLVEGAPMPPRAHCPGGDHRPPATGGSCACGMVTRVLSAPSRGPSVRRAADARPRCVMCLARCLYDGPGDPLAPDAPTTAPTPCGCPTILRRRAEQMLAALAAAALSAAGLVVHRRRRRCPGRLTRCPDGAGQSGSAPSAGAAAASRSRARSSQCWHSCASSSPRSHRPRDSSRVSPPASSRRTTSASSSRACS